MDLETVRAEKAKMDNTIAMAAATAVREFRKATGITPSSIDVSMVRVAQVGERDQYVVGSVTSDFNIFGE